MHQLKVLVILVLLIFSNIPSVNAVEDGIVAVVNDELITLNDLKHYIKTTHMNLSTQRFNPQDIKRYMKDLEVNGLEKLIEDKLILSKANEIQLAVNEDAVKEKLEEYKKRYPSEEVFMEALISHGGTMTDMINKIKEQLKIKYVIDYEIRSQIYINPYEITDYYNDNLNEFQKDSSVDLESIYVGYKQDKEAAKAKIDKAYTLIQTGEDFSAVNKEYSDTPSIGTIEKGQMVSSIEDVVFALDRGETSQIVETDTGYFIFKLKAKNDAQVAKLADVKPYIKNKVFELKFRQKYKDWLEELKSNAYIEIKK